MKVKNALKVFYFALVLFGLSACTVAEEYDIFHRDGKTYITSLKVRSGASAGSNLGTRTFFDTGDNFGAVYWEDGTTNTAWKGLETGDTIYRPDHIYFFDKNMKNYGYVDNISEFYCAEQTTRYYSGHYDFDNYQWATFNLLKGKTPLMVNAEGDPHSYYGYYCPRIVGHNLETDVFDFYKTNQVGQGNVVLRNFLREHDVLRLEVPDNTTGTENQQSADGSNGIFEIPDEACLTIDDQDGRIRVPDIYFSHIFALVEVALVRNPDAVKEGEVNPGGFDLSNNLRNVFNFQSDNDGGVVYGDPQLSDWPLTTVDLCGSGNTNFLFVTCYKFSDIGKWEPNSYGTNYRCVRPVDDNVSIVTANDTLKYYFLVRSYNKLSTMSLVIHTPQFEAGGDVVEGSDYCRTIKFTFTKPNSFLFYPGKYYRISIDVGVPEQFSDNNTRTDKNWIESSFNMLRPSKEMNLDAWGIKGYEETWGGTS